MTLWDEYDGIECSRGAAESYDLDGDLTDTLGAGASLSAKGGSIIDGEYVFSPNQGLRLTNTLANTASYGVEMRFRMTDRNPVTTSSSIFRT